VSRLGRSRRPYSLALPAFPLWPESPYTRANPIVGSVTITARRPPIASVLAPELGRLVRFRHGDGQQARRPLRGCQDFAHHLSQASESTPTPRYPTPSRDCPLWLTPSLREVATRPRPDSLAGDPPPPPPPPSHCWSSAGLRTFSSPGTQPPRDPTAAAPTTKTKHPPWQPTRPFIQAVVYRPLRGVHPHHGLRFRNAPPTRTTVRSCDAVPRVRGDRVTPRW